MNSSYFKGRRRLDEIRAALTERSSGNGFVIRHRSRQPKDGAGSVDGLRKEGALDLYRRTLEWALEYLTSAEVGINAGKLSIEVLCFEISEWKGDPDPVTADTKWGTLVALPSRTSLTTADLERQNMVSAAAHEITHVVCANAPGMGSIAHIRTGHWWWIAEATAVWVETILASKRTRLPRTLDWLLYTLNWCDYPEMPLDSYEGMYQSAQFLRYLVNLHGKKFVGNLWNAGRADEDAWLTIERLTERTRDELFAEYAAESYLLNEPQSKCYFPEVYERFGGRLAAESRILSPGKNVDVSGDVWPLGCRYYRINPSEAASVEVEWNGEGAYALVLGAATEELRQAAKPITLRGAGKQKVDSGGARNHVWVAICGKADSLRARFSFSVRAL